MNDFYFSAASGSAGNCGIFHAEGTNILLDLGASVRSLTQTLKSLNMSFDDISAVLLTHEHSDHTKGMGTFCKKYDIPIYASFGTAAALKMKLPQAEHLLQPFSAGEIFDINGLKISSCSTPHDAADSVCYRIDSKENSFAYVTDLGYMTDDIKEHTSGCDTVVLEANHDLEMLRTGPYPMYLKERIHGKYGHLCNDDCAQAAVDFVQSGTKRIVLSHLSEKNNRPLTAYHSVQYALEKSKLKCDLYVAPKNQMTQPVFMEDDKQCCLFA